MAAPVSPAQIVRLIALKLFFPGRLEEYLSGLQIAQYLVADPHRHGGFAQTGEALQGFRFEGRLFFDPLLQLEARRAGPIAPGQERAKRIYLFGALERGPKRTCCPQH